MAEYKVTVTLEYYIKNVVDKYDAIENAYHKIITKDGLTDAVKTVNTELISE